LQEAVPQILEEDDINVVILPANDDGIADDVELMDHEKLIPITSADVAGEVEVQ